MSLSPLEKATIDAIVSVFESGSPTKYDTIVGRDDDAGGLSYGKHQAALMAGSLYTLLDAYCKADGAACAAKFSPYMSKIQAKDRAALDHDQTLKAILVEASADPVMRRTQDAFFTEHYMQPAIDEAAHFGFQTPLGYAVVYDSMIHGSWNKGADIKARTIAKVGEPTNANEKDWISAYLRERRAWLATNANPLLQRTVYRPDTFLDLIARDQWNLDLPLTLKVGYTVTAWDFSDVSLFPDPIYRVDPAHFGELRPHVTNYPQGRDLHVQELLYKLKLVTDRNKYVDGKYGTLSAGIVHSFQLSRGLPATGIVDSDTYLHLRSAAESGGDLRPLPASERNRTGTALGTGGVAAGGLAAGAAAIAISQDDSSSSTSAPATADASTAPPPPAVTTDTAQASVSTSTSTEASAAPPTPIAANTPAATQTNTTGSTTVAPVHHLSPTTEMFAWGALSLALVMIVLVTFARRRAY